MYARAVARSSRGSRAASTVQPALHERLHLRRPVGERLARSARRARARAADARRAAPPTAAPQQPVHGRAPRLPRDRASARPGPSPRSRRPRPRAIDAPAGAVGREHDDLRRRDRARAHAGDAARRPSRARGANPCDSSRADRRPGRGDHEPAEAVFVAAPRELGAVGRPRERTLTRTPRGLGVLAALGEHGRAFARRRASATHSTGQPSASETNASCVPSGEKRGWPQPPRRRPTITRTLAVGSCAA